MADWKKIKAEYIKGGISYRELAKKHGVSFNTLKRKATEELWYDLRQQSDHKATTRIVEEVSQKQAERACDIVDVADMLIDKIVDIIQAETPQTTQSIKSLTSALKDLKDIKGYKTEADRREQEARIAKLIKEAQDNTDEDIEIKVTMVGDLDKYSK